MSSLKVKNSGSIQTSTSIALRAVAIDSQSNGNIYANIAAITPVPAGVTVPEPKSPILKFAWRNPSTKEKFMAEEFGKLPKFLQEKIESSNEYKALGGDPAANTPFAAATVSGDSLPF